MSVIIVRQVTGPQIPSRLLRDGDIAIGGRDHFDNLVQHTGDSLQALGRPVGNSWTPPPHYWNLKKLLPGTRLKIVNNNQSTPL